MAREGGLVIQKPRSLSLTHSLFGFLYISWGFIAHCFTLEVAKRKGGLRGTVGKGFFHARIECYGMRAYRLFTERGFLKFVIVFL